MVHLYGYLAARCELTLPTRAGLNDPLHGWRRASATAALHRSPVPATAYMARTEALTDCQARSSFSSARA